MDREVYYGISFYRSESLKFWAKKYLEYLPEDVKCLLVAGSSGMAIASAMVAMSGRPLQIEYADRNKKGHGGCDNYLDPSCFVDDFISSGKTFKRVIDEDQCGDYQPKYILVHHTTSTDHIPKKYLNGVTILNIREIENGSKRKPSKIPSGAAV